MSKNDRYELANILEDITVVSEDDDGEEVEVEEKPSSAPDGVNPDAGKVYSYLGVDSDNPKDLEYANEIYNYAKSIAASEEEADILWAVRELSQSVRTSEFGGSKLKTLYAYVGLQQKKQSIEKEISAYER